MIKEYHFYISDDRTHDTHFVQHCIEFFLYDSLKSRKVEFNEHWIWSDGCAGQFKSSRSFFLLFQIHKVITLNIAGISLKLDMEKVNMMM